MNLLEQIKAFQLKRQECQDRQKAIMVKAGEEDRTLEDDESAEYDSLKTELKAIDSHLARLEEQLADDAETAEPPRPSSAVKSKTGGVTILSRRHDPDDAFPGQSFTRRAIAKALAHMSGGELRPGEVADQRWGKTHPQLVQVIKTGVAGGASDTGEWGAELVQADGRFTGDFIEFLASMTVYDKLPLRQIPHNVTVKGQDGIATGYWVGQGLGIPVSAQDFSAVTLTPLKVAAISVITKELIADSSPAAEMLVRDGLAEALAQRTDTTFISNSSAVTGVSPAGMLQGLSSLGSNGITADALRQDIAELYAPFLSAKNASGLWFVMTPTLAKRISLLYNALGQKEFTDLRSTGGTLEGDPVVTGDNVGATNLILLKPSDIYRIGDSGLQVSISQDATIEQDTQPTGDSVSPTAASATLMSMYQTESVAIKIVRRINFAKRRTSAVAFIGDAQYGIAGATTA